MKAAIGIFTLTPTRDWVASIGPEKEETWISGFLNPIRATHVKISTRRVVCGSGHSFGLNTRARSQTVGRQSIYERIREPAQQRSTRPAGNSPTLGRLRISSAFLRTA
jgi:hypothetical protein